jgi:hypothetical protein
MTAKSVLNRIATLLSLDNEEVNFTDAKTADGTILQSPTFDLGETVEVVSEDGTKTPAPDGEHEIALKDSEGKDVIIRVVTKDGKITERENVEEKQPDLAKVDEEVVDKKAAVEEQLADATTETAKGLPNTTDESDANEVATPDTEDPIITLGARMDEMEKNMKSMMEKMESAYPSEGLPEVSSLTPSGVNMSVVSDEEELPKLDGAPIDLVNNIAAIEQNKKNYGKKDSNSQSSFLSKLYK